MKKIISVLLVVLMTMAVSVTAFAAEDGGNDTITTLPGSVDIPVTLSADVTPGYKGPVENGKATVSGPGFTAKDETPPEGAVRLVVIPIDDEEAIKWFSGCAGTRWNSTGTFYAVFYENAKGEQLKANSVKLTVQVPGGYENLQVYSLDPDESGQFVDRFDTVGSSVTFTTNGRLYYGVVHRQGTVDEETEVGPGAPGTTVDMMPDELADAVLTDEDRAYLDEGIDVHLKLTVEDITDTVSASDKQAVESAANGYTVGEYIDIELLKQIGDRPWENIHETRKPIRITINIPERLLGVEGREFAIVRVHNGTAEFLTDLDDNPATITFETNKFSTYAILYRDPSKPDNPDKPDKPNNPDNPDKPDKPGNSPQTGDNSNLNLWLAIMGMSIAGIILVFFYSRKKKHEERVLERDE